MKLLYSIFGLLLLFSSAGLIYSSCSRAYTYYYIDRIHTSNIVFSDVAPTYLEGPDVKANQYGIRVFNHLHYANVNAWIFPNLCLASTTEDYSLSNAIKEINVYQVKHEGGIQWPKEKVNHKFRGRFSYEFDHRYQDMNGLAKSINTRTYTDAGYRMEPFDIYLIEQPEDEYTASFIVELILVPQDTLRDTTGYVNLSLP